MSGHCGDWRRCWAQSIHRHWARFIAKLAGLLADLGELAEARTLCERALSGYENALGLNDPSTCYVAYNLAFLLKAEGDLSAARAMFQRALSGFEKCYGANHPETLECRRRLDDCESLRSADDPPFDCLSLLSPAEADMLIPLFELGFDRPKEDFVAAFIACGKDVKQTAAMLLDGSPIPPLPPALAIIATASATSASADTARTYFAAIEGTSTAVVSESTDGNQMDSLSSCLNSLVHHFVVLIAS